MDLGNMISGLTGGEDLGKGLKGEAGQEIVKQAIAKIRETTGQEVPEDIRKEILAAASDPSRIEALIAEFTKK